jgi:hypothetical protein
MMASSPRVAVSAAVAVLAVVSGAGVAQAVSFGPTDARLTSMGGLATDPAGRYWTANASESVVYALSPTGSVSGKVSLGLTPKDAEALVVSGTTLYVADIGDKSANRTTIAVYALDTPAIGTTATVKTYRFAYPDKKSRDAQALLVTAAGQQLIVAKDGGVYAAPSPLVAGANSTNALTLLGQVPQGVTDGVALPDGRLALRSAATLYVCDGATLAVSSQQDIAGQATGGSLGLSLDGTTLLLVPRSYKGKVEAISVPAPLAATPSQASSVTPSDAPTPSPSGTEEDPSAAPTASVATLSPAEQAAAHDQSGSVLALLGAAVLAILAGVVVMFKR